LEKPLTLTIPPRTNANQTFRLRGKGMPYLREPNKRGDMFARVKLVLPTALTDKEVERITALASARQKRVEPSEVKL
jgi:curved DNA-binding protein